MKKRLKATSWCTTRQGHQFLLDQTREKHTKEVMVCPSTLLLEDHADDSAHSLASITSKGNGYNNTCS